MVNEIKIEENEGDIERAFKSCKVRWKVNTQKPYSLCLTDYKNFCRDRGVLALPAAPETVVEFLLAREAASIAGLSQRLAVIGAIHDAARGWLPRGHPERVRYTLDDPIIIETWEEIKRQKSGEETPKAAVRSRELGVILQQIPNNLKGTQDRAILCVGLAFALRRSEIVALDRDDVELGDNGMTVGIHLNGGQDGRYDTRTVVRTGDATCPVAAMERWSELSQIAEGAVFKNRPGNRQPPRYPNTIIKEYGAKAGFDAEVLGGESLRKGCIFDRIQNGDLPEAAMRFARIKRERYFEYLGAKIAQPNDNEERDIAEITNDKTLSSSERKTLIDARRGQGKFRAALRARWNDACAVTGCAVLEVLRASHIQPWSTSTNEERLNTANGLLLDANLDALFDSHLISFANDGQMLLAANIPEQERQRLGVPGRLRKPLTGDEKRFLAKHRAAGGFSEL